MQTSCVTLPPTHRKLLECIDTDHADGESTNLVQATSGDVLRGCETRKIRNSRVQSSFARPWTRSSETHPTLWLPPSCHATCLRSVSHLEASRFSARYKFEGGINPCPHPVLVLLFLRSANLTYVRQDEFQRVAHFVVHSDLSQLPL